MSEAHASLCPLMVRPLTSPSWARGVVYLGLLSTPLFISTPRPLARFSLASSLPRFSLSYSKTHHRYSNRRRVLSLGQANQATS